MKSVAGVLCGKDKHTVCVVDDDGKYLKSMKLMGDRVYLARCRQPGVDGPVVLTDKSQDNNNCFLVLAVGVKCSVDLKPLDKCGCPDIVWEAMMPGYETKDERIVWGRDVLLGLDED